jgi:hypothetical protein
MVEPRFRAFGIGIAKTGTNSLAQMFADRYRTAHEPEKQALLKLILERARYDHAAFCAEVRGVLDPLALEMNASQLNGHILGSLLDLYPDAKFVLTLRDPASWASSFANHQLTRGRLAPDSLWARFRDLRFAGDGSTGGNDVYPLERYLDYWLGRNLHAIGVVPQHRLLVVRTERLRDESPLLATFLGLDAATIVPARVNTGAYDDGPSPFDAQELAAAAERYAARFTHFTGIEI